MTIEQLKKTIIEVIFKYINPDDCFIFVFGSYATDRAKISSDIDIGLIPQHTIPDNVMARLRIELSSQVKTLREIQLFDFTNVNKDFKDIATKEVKIWHKGKNCLKEIL